MMQKWVKIILWIVISICLVALGVVIYILVFHTTTAQPDIGVKANTHAQVTQTPSATPYNFLNGTPLTQAQYAQLIQRRPLAIMIPNTPDARPQSGINQADVVYEALTEGPITRFMGIFWSHQNDYTIMPIRSIRVYFLQWLLEYNDIIVMHTGYAATDNPQTNALAILQNYHVKTLIWDYPWTYDATCQKTIPSWDCSYSDTIKLWNTAAKHGWTGASWAGLPIADQWKFKDTTSDTTLPTATTITIPFLYPNDYSQVTWKYNQTDNTYLSYDYQNKPRMDKLDASQFVTKTLVVEQVGYAQTHDIKDRSIQQVIGSGNAYVFEDGKVIKATWKKADITSRTRFYDTLGQEIAFNRGKIWITVIPNTQTISMH